MIPADRFNQFKRSAIARGLVRSFALAAVVVASKADIREEATLARQADVINGSDSIRDEDLPELHSQLKFDDKAARAHEPESDALLNAKERRELRKEVLKMKARQMAHRASL